MLDPGPVDCHSGAMPLVLVLLLVAVFGYLWIARRKSSLTRTCRWRLDRTLGANTHRCAACGAVCMMPAGQSPNACLRD